MGYPREGDTDLLFSSRKRGWSAPSPTFTLPTVPLSPNSVSKSGKEWLMTWVFGFSKPKSQESCGVSELLRKEGKRWETSSTLVRLNASSFFFHQPSKLSLDQIENWIDFFPMYSFTFDRQFTYVRASFKVKYRAAISSPLHKKFKVSWILRRYKGNPRIERVCLRSRSLTPNLCSTFLLVLGFNWNEFKESRVWIDLERPRVFIPPLLLRILYRLKSVLWKSGLLFFRFSLHST
jgi:hypothetical protein